MVFTDSATFTSFTSSHPHTHKHTHTHTYIYTQVKFFADGGASFTKAAGLELDTGDFGGVRIQRMSALVCVCVRVRMRKRESVCVCVWCLQRDRPR
jgi:peroxiredoxin